jgi:hypothetical protein
MIGGVLETGEKIEVEAYSGFKANERPRTLRVAGRSIGVEEVIERWRGERHDYFKIKGDDGQRYTSVTTGGRTDGSSWVMRAWEHERA